MSVYCYANAGDGESTTDLVFGGQDIIAENGSVVTEGKRFNTGLYIADVDLQRIMQERARMTTFPEIADPLRDDRRSAGADRGDSDRRVSADGRRRGVPGGHRCSGGDIGRTARGGRSRPPTLCRPEAVRTEQRGGASCPL